MKLTFLVEYIKNLRSVGAVAPSSKYLARRMVQGIDFKKARVLVELGAGTGVFTHEIVQRLDPQAKLLVVENNAKFHHELIRKYGTLDNVYITDASAENLTDLLKRHKLSRDVDYIVSGLPFASLPAQVSQSILASAKRHTRGGEFITFQYTLLKKPLLETYFSQIKVAREFRNLPPAYILRAKN